MEGKAEWYRKKALKRANENEKVPKMEEVPKPANTMMKFVTKGVAKSDHHKQETEPNTKSAGTAEAQAAQLQFSQQDKEHNASSGGDTEILSSSSSDSPYTHF